MNCNRNISLLSKIDSEFMCQLVTSKELELFDSLDTCVM